MLQIFVLLLLVLGALLWGPLLGAGPQRLGHLLKIISRIFIVIGPVGPNFRFAFTK